MKRQLSKRSINFALIAFSILGVLNLFFLIKNPTEKLNILNFLVDIVFIIYFLYKKKELKDNENKK